MSWRLNETAACIRIGRTPLQQSLMSITMKDSPQVAQNRQIAKDADWGARCLILISLLTVWSPFRISLAVSHSTLTGNAPSGKDGAAYLALAKEHQRLEAILPAGWGEDFTTFFTLSGEALMALMTFCVSCSVDGVQTRECGHTSRSNLIELEAALGFHMRDWWHPTKAGFFGDLKHTQIVDALNEAGFTGAASDATKMKKGDAADLAEDRMRDTRWVPAWMMGPDAEKNTDQTVASETDSDSDNNNDSAQAA